MGIIYIYTDRYMYNRIDSRLIYPTIYGYGKRGYGILCDGRISAWTCARHRNTFFCLYVDMWRYFNKMERTAMMVHGDSDGVFNMADFASLN